jgi:hypothetical protein
VSRLQTGIFIRTISARQRGDLNFKNDWQKEKVNYGQRLLNLKKNKFRQSEDRSHEG